MPDPGLGRGPAEDRNRRFYNRFPFPPPPASLERIADPRFGLRMLAQELGAWDGSVLPARPRIWVAGCGSFQAVRAALRFPTARVVGSDLSDRSLETCEAVARGLGVTNLELRCESLLEARDPDGFDYVSCVGVLHHLEDPGRGLRALRTALRPRGILELMVYNRFHRIECRAVQRALGRLRRSGESESDPAYMEMARRLLAEYPARGRLGTFVGLSESETLFADTYLQPVEHAFTVGSLDAAARAAGLELVLPRAASWDRSWSGGTWEIEVYDEGLRERLDALPDPARWDVVNHLLRDESPLLWFYLGTAGARRRSPDARALRESFLECRFEPLRTTRRRFVRRPDGGYEPAGEAEPYPPPPDDPEVCRVLGNLDTERPLRATLERLGLADDPVSVERLRQKTTTARSPYLAAVRESADGEGEAPGFAGDAEPLVQRLRRRSRVAHRPVAGVPEPT